MANEAMGTCRHPCGHLINPSTPHIKESGCLAWQPLAPAEPKKRHRRFTAEDVSVTQHGPLEIEGTPAEPAARSAPNNLGKVFGTWPGDETDAELLGALEEIRNPAEPTAVAGIYTNIELLVATVQNLEAQIAEMTDDRLYWMGLASERRCLMKEMATALATERQRVREDEAVINHIAGGSVQGYVLFAKTRNALAREQTTTWGRPTPE
jgi:hypothetical protein